MLDAAVYITVFHILVCMVEGHIAENGSEGRNNFMLQNSLECYVREKDNMTYKRVPWCRRCRVKMKRVPDRILTYECPQCGLTVIKAWNRKKK